MYQHCQNPFAIKQRRKSVDLSKKSFSCSLKQLLAIHSLLATSNACPMTIPEFFAQTRVSDYWQLIHYTAYPAYSWLSRINRKPNNTSNGPFE